MIEYIFDIFVGLYLLFGCRITNGVTSVNSASYNACSPYKTLITKNIEYDNERLV